MWFDNVFKSNRFARWINVYELWRPRVCGWSDHVCLYLAPGFQHSLRCEPRLRLVWCCFIDILLISPCFYTYIPIFTVISPIISRLFSTDKVRVKAQARLMLLNVSVADNGVYSCSGENNAGAAVSGDKFILNVKGQYRSLRYTQGGQIWAQSGSDWSQTGQTWDF